MRTLCCRFFRKKQNIGIIKDNLISVVCNGFPKSLEKLTFIRLGDNKMIAMSTAEIHIFIRGKFSFAVKFTLFEIRISVIYRI